MTFRLALLISGCAAVVLASSERTAKPVTPVKIVAAVAPAQSRQAGITMKGAPAQASASVAWGNSVRCATPAGCGTTSPSGSSSPLLTEN
jgi:hypothetical protein